MGTRSNLPSPHAAAPLAIRAVDARLPPGVGRGTLSVYLRRVTGLQGRGGAGASGGSGGAGAAQCISVHLRPRVSLSICGQQQSGCAPLGKGGGRTQEWNQAYP